MHASRDIARKAAVLQITRPGTSAPPLAVYQCPDCNHWHLTRSLKGADKNRDGKILVVAPGCFGYTRA
jgi:hypothetical protein